VLLTALAGLLAVACLAVGGVHLARLALLRTDPAGELSYAAMGAGMAAMFSPLGDPVPATAWIAVFVLCGIWSASTVPRRAAAVDQVLGSGAMLFMLLAGHGRGGGVGSVAAIVLAGYFGWHVLRCADRLRALPAPPAGALRVRVGWLRDARVAAGAHVVMAAAMAVMLVGMV
jgi:hypothetical protein